MNFKNEIKNEKVMSIFYVYFVQNGIGAPNQKKQVKVGWTKLNKTF